jgi:hypothetical protein
MTTQLTDDIIEAILSETGNEYDESQIISITEDDLRDILETTLDKFLNAPTMDEALDTLTDEE